MSDAIIVAKINHLQNVIRSLQVTQSELMSYDISKLEYAGTNMWEGAKWQKFHQRYETVFKSVKKTENVLEDAVNDAQSRIYSLASQIKDPTTKMTYLMLNTEYGGYYGGY
jgi:hypothetical protein